MPIATFSLCQAGPITVATGVDDFTEPVATVIFIASCTGPHGGRWYTYVHIRMCANGHVACWCKEHPVENVVFAIFFMQSKRN
jgi:hypothetical protein